MDKDIVAIFLVVLCVIGASMVFYFLINIVITIVEYVRRSFIQTVDEDEVWFVTNNFGERKYSILKPGRYLKFWRLYTVNSIYGYPFLKKITVSGSTTDGVSLSMTLDVSLEFEDGFNGETLVEAERRIDIKIVGSALSVITSQTLSEVIKTKSFSESKAAETNELAKSLFLKATITIRGYCVKVEEKP